MYTGNYAIGFRKEITHLYYTALSYCLEILNIILAQRLCNVFAQTMCFLLAQTYIFLSGTVCCLSQVDTTIVGLITHDTAYNPSMSYLIYH